jgi:tRNA-splicing ligase RtcB
VIEFYIYIMMIMKSRDLKNIGIPKGEAMKAAFKAIKELAKTGREIDYEALFIDLVQNPENYLQDTHLSGLASILVHHKSPPPNLHYGQKKPAPYAIWGNNHEPGAIDQMTRACQLPVSIRGALMPDAHLGYGLPIGGVLATKKAVVPYAVGVDIACRMKMTVLDMPASTLTDKHDDFKDALVRETLFGVGAAYRKKRKHKVMDINWSFSPVIKKLKDKAWAQLGTSGSGNHFVEFGTLSVEKGDFTLQPGVYLALLSHSGSRGTGAQIANHYSRLARKLHPELQRELANLAWLSLDTQEGQEYWQAMQLMGRYASANHALIHEGIIKKLGAEVLLEIENHHNFAWKETHDNEKVIVHRKGATPAGKGVFGIIPGSMATPGYIIRGKGNGLSLHSASHGAGRKMSRTAAKKTFSWKEVREHLDRLGVTVITAGLDEVPMAYKDIEEVMKAQTDLVDRMARFDPKIVRMAKGSERPED